MKQRIPEHHPVDAFFQREAGKIPVAYDPQHWEALSALLDQHPATQQSDTDAGAQPDIQPGPTPRLRSIGPALGLLILIVGVASDRRHERPPLPQPDGPALSYPLPAPPTLEAPAPLAAPAPVVETPMIASPHIRTKPTNPEPHRMEMPTPGTQQSALSQDETSPTAPPPDSLSPKPLPLRDALENLQRPPQRKNLFW